IFIHHLSCFPLSLSFCYFCSDRPFCSFPTRRSFRSPMLSQTPRCRCLRTTSARLWTVRRFQNPMSQASIPSHCQHRKNNHFQARSEEHTSELQSRFDLVCRLLLEKENNAHY